MNAAEQFMAMALISISSLAIAGQAEADCFAVPQPVITLDHGSRYTADSKTRSDFDAVSNAAVNQALKPVDRFIVDLAKASNKALSDPSNAAAHVACVADALAVWAKAGALSDLASIGAQMSSPSRIGGMAFAYASVRPMLTDLDQRDLIDEWLRDRADAIVVFWDRDSPPKASRNNLRAWAAVAVARIGLSIGAEDLQHWAAYSALRVACGAGADGNLPLEMARGRFALHYQLHGVGPLVVTAALLESEGFSLFRACDRAIPRAVDFAVAALGDPDIVTALAGEKQSYETGEESLRGFELAWAVAYLKLFENRELRELIANFDDLAHSKLGGTQSLIWGPKG